MEKMLESQEGFDRFFLKKGKVLYIFQCMNYLQVIFLKYMGLFSLDN